MGPTLSTLKSLKALLVGLMVVTLSVDPWQESLSRCFSIAISSQPSSNHSQKKCKLLYGLVHSVFLTVIFQPNQGLNLFQLPNTDYFRFLTAVPDLNITRSPLSIQKYATLPSHADLKNHLIHQDLSSSVSNLNDISCFQYCFALSHHSYPILPRPNPYSLNWSFHLRSASQTSVLVCHS